MRLPEGHAQEISDTGPEVCRLPELPLWDRRREAHILPIGDDAPTWAYQVTAADVRRYFCKLRTGKVQAESAAMARYL
jgi:hypothetical protein